MVNNITVGSETHLILRRAEQVVPSGMKGESSDTCVVRTHNLDTVAPSDGPHTDGAVWRCREGHSLQGENMRESLVIQTLGRDPECRHYETLETLNVTWEGW